MSGLADGREVARFRGMDTLSALTIHLEFGGDWERFSSPRRLFAWLGLTPSLDQSGQSSHSEITKTGSCYARRLLVEAAWHYARPPRIGVALATARPARPITSCRSPGAPSTAYTACITA